MQRLSVDHKSQVVQIESLRWRSDATVVQSCLLALVYPADSVGGIDSTSTISLSIWRWQWRIWLRCIIQNFEALTPEGGMTNSQFPFPQSIHVRFWFTQGRLVNFKLKLLLTSEAPRSNFPQNRCLSCSREKCQLCVHFEKQNFVWCGFAGELTQFKKTCFSQIDLPNKFDQSWRDLWQKTVRFKTSKFTSQAHFPKVKGKQTFSLFVQQRRIFVNTKEKCWKANSNTPMVPHELICNTMESTT